MANFDVNAQKVTVDGLAPVMQALAAADVARLASGAWGYPHGY